MTREELIGLISADAKFMNERDAIASTSALRGEGLRAAIRDGCARSRPRRTPGSPTSPPGHGLATAALQTFVDGILDRMILMANSSATSWPRSTSAGKPAARLNWPDGRPATCSSTRRWRVISGLKRV